MTKFTHCPGPECGAIAEVMSELEFDSTSGPIIMRRTLCLHQHIYDEVVEVM